MPMSPRVKPVANVGCYLRAFQNACVCRIVQIKARGLSADQTDSNTRATATSIDKLASKVCISVSNLGFPIPWHDRIQSHLHLSKLKRFEL